MIAAAVVAAGLLFQTVRLLTDTRETVHQWDRENFLSDIAHAGYGVSEAVQFLIEQSRAGGYILLTDPIWGPPSDAMFPYLNRRYGIQVFEAWWTQLSGTHPILPAGAAEVLHSHYERTKAGSVDFSRAPRVFYVTDTNYYNPQAVRIRQPNARLVASFPKPGGRHSIDVYRLK